MENNHHNFQIIHGRGRKHGDDEERSEEEDHEFVKKTHLCTHVRQAATRNKKELGMLTGLHVSFKCSDFAARENVRRVLDTICRAPKNLELAVGAQVILIKTIDPSCNLVNGTRGVVVRFTRKTEQPVVRFEHGVERIILPEVWTVHGGSSGGGVVASRRQLPLDLAWAISVHKSQGMTLSRVSLNLSNTFEYGQGYVALSRVKSLKGLEIVGEISKKTFLAHPKVLRFYQAAARGEF
jgi:ATP-dependent DNA helicase PIF1